MAQQKRFSSFEAFGKDSGRPLPKQEDSYPKKDTNSYNKNNNYKHDFFREYEADILNFENINDYSRQVKFMNEFEDYVKKQGRDITIGQLRVVYSLIKKAENAKELQLVRPQIAFVAGKQTDTFSKNIIDQILTLVSKANENNYKHIGKFIESFLHYHKFYHAK